MEIGPMLKNNFENRLCDYCDSKKRKMKLCNGCLNVFYCSQDCQNSGWKKHKSYCIRIDKWKEHQMNVLNQVD